MMLLALGLFSVVSYEVARAWYRPFVYSQGLNDFHIADTLGNSLGTIATALVLASIFGQSHIQTLFVLRAGAIGVAVFEVLHPLLGKPIDPFDILATVLSGLLCQGVYRWVYRRELALQRVESEA
jgi:hypothetical protein